MALTFAGHVFALSFRPAIPVDTWACQGGAIWPSKALLAESSPIQNYAMLQILAIVTHVSLLTVARLDRSIVCTSAMAVPMLTRWTKVTRFATALASHAALMSLWCSTVAWTTRRITCHPGVAVIAFAFSIIARAMIRTIIGTELS